MERKPTFHVHLDKFADTFRQIHSRHLALIRESLLLSDQATAAVIRDIMVICRRFTGLVERWGGDVLPELLGEDEIGEREMAVNEIAEVGESLPVRREQLMS